MKNVVAGLGVTLHELNLGLYNNDLPMAIDTFKIE